MYFGPEISGHLPEVARIVHSLWWPLSTGLTVLWSSPTWSCAYFRLSSFYLFLFFTDLVLLAAHSLWNKCTWIWIRQIGVSIRQIMYIQRKPLWCCMHVHVLKRLYSRKTRANIFNFSLQTFLEWTLLHFVNCRHVKLENCDSNLCEQASSSIKPNCPVKFGKLLLLNY